MRSLFKVILLALLSACSTHSDSTVEAPTKDYFPQQKGCFLLYNLKTSQFDKVIGEENCRERFSASSTFKIPLALMAFDAGVLKDENSVLKWDGKKDARLELNRDHNAKSWMKESVVWFSQRLTPKLGQRKIQEYLRKFQYGNQDMSGGLTQAWLNAPRGKVPALSISSFEQVEFMKRLWMNELDISPRAMALTREITYLETSAKGFKLHGKTGSNYFDADRKIRLGWFVSHVADAHREYIAVTSFSDSGSSSQPGYGGPHARELTKQILSDLNLW